MRALEEINRLTEAYISALHPLHPLEPSSLEAVFIFLFTSVPYSILLSVSLSGKITELSLFVPVVLLGFWAMSALWLWMVNSFREIRRIFLCSSSLLALHLPIILLLAPYFHLYGFGIYGKKALYFWAIFFLFVGWSMLRLKTTCSTLGMGRTKTAVAVILPLALGVLVIHLGLIYISNGNFSLMDFFRLL